MPRARVPAIDSKPTATPVAAPADGDLSFAPLEPDAFRKALSVWFGKHARSLPWRGVHDPYATWLSEIMLQQTRVATVMERYTEFLRRFPTIAALAAAPEDDVLALWSGLGYYRRARMLHRGAQFVSRELGGSLPGTAVELRTLPGIGEYTAAAIASIAFGQSIAVLDGNVERVLLRLLGLPEEKSAAARSVLLRTAESLVPPAPRRRGKGNPPGDHNQAMMELGATICLPRGPLCLHCPVFAFCRTRGEHLTAARTPLRSRRVAALLATRKRGTATEILLERRAAEASLMPGMLELPPLPPDAAEGREPILRLRHSITDTNYYVEIFAEGASGGGALPPTGDLGTADPAAFPDDPVRPARELPLPFALEMEEQADGEDAVFQGEPGLLGAGPTLRDQVPASEDDLLWCASHRLHELPLTGLARKALQRLGLMVMLPVRVGHDAI